MAWRAAHARPLCQEYCGLHTKCCRLTIYYYCCAKRRAYRRWHARARATIPESAFVPTTFLFFSRRPYTLVFDVTRYIIVRSLYTRIFTFIHLMSCGQFLGDIFLFWNWTFRQRDSLYDNIAFSRAAAKPFLRGDSFSVPSFCWIFTGINGFWCFNGAFTLRVWTLYVT